MLKEVKITDKDLSKIFVRETSAQRAKRVVIRSLRQLVLFGLVYLLFFVLINSPAIYKIIRYKFNPVTPVATATPTNPYQTTTKNNLIEIDKIGLSAPLIVNNLAGDILTDLKSGVAVYADTAKPGEIGNSVLIGHSSDYPWSNGQYKTVFAPLVNMVTGDKISVYYNNTRFDYEVTNRKIVAPTEVSVLNPTSTPVLTLLTCYPVGTSQKRLIVTAKLISDNATTVQSAQPNSTLPTPR